MYNDIIGLGTPVTETDDRGNEVTECEFRDVFCKVKSITRTEFYQAAVTDYKPSIAFEIADYFDYNNERIILYNGEKYEVIRTYRADVGSKLGLVAQRYGDGK